MQAERVGWEEVLLQTMLLPSLQGLFQMLFASTGGLLLYGEEG